MHPVIEFYLEQRKSQHNLSLQDMRAMPKRMIGDAYFYIPWLLLVTESSKWNRSVLVFNEEDLAIFIGDEAIQNKYLHSIDIILDYFCLYREDNKIFPKPELTERKVWLRNIGHESKKISRIIRSLNYCGHTELAKSLQQLAIKLGQEKGVIQEETIGIWTNLLK
ncbi:TPA: opioid growth factor receptor-related protein [Haemophilus influenzae]